MRVVTTFQRAHDRNVANLQPLIGGDAARTTVTANTFQAIGGLVLLFLCLPLSIWAQVGAPALLWVPAGVAGIGGTCTASRGAVLANRSGRLASEYLSRQLGRPITVPGGGWRRSVWEARIQRRLAEGPRAPEHE